MAGNLHPWRDIFTVAQWQNLTTTIGSQPATHALLGQLTTAITQYHALQKDDYLKFAQRANKLRDIATLAGAYGAVKTTPVRTKTGRKDASHIDQWVTSLANRAKKKAGYLEAMFMAIMRMKPKYRDATQLLEFLWDMQRNNATGGNSQFLHAGVYATIEKTDPYHRHFGFHLAHGDLRGVMTGKGLLYVRPWNPANNLTAVALRDYFNQMIAGVATTIGTNANASFYEWLEYHPICTGQPHFDWAAGTDPYRVFTITYSPTVHPTRISWQKLQIDVGSTGNFTKLNTATHFPASGKGPVGAAAFVWAKDGTLWLHEHGGNFVHTSFKGGHTIRCSGMMVVTNGKVTEVTNMSGHYAPGGLQMYYLVYWLRNIKHVMGDSATVQVDHASNVGTHDPNGTHRAEDYVKMFRDVWGIGRPRAFVPS